MDKKSNSISENYIKPILYYLKDFSKIPKIENKEELLEYELDVFSANFYENLLHNFLYFYTINETKKIDSDAHKYLIKEIVNILDIIYETFPEKFMNKDFLKSLLIYLIYSLKETRIINIEIVLQIFYGFYDVFPSKSNESINGELIKFETDSVKTIKKLIKKYIEHFEIDVRVPESENNFYDIIDNLREKIETPPLYLKGYIDYSELIESKKFLIIKIYNYLKK